MSLSKDLIKFNSQTAARDKIFRLAQYGSRLLLWQLTQGSSNVAGEVVTRLSKLEAALGLSRKLFRLGNCVDLAHKAVDAFSIQNAGIRALTVTSHAMKSLWLFIDHFLWFGKVGVIKTQVRGFRLNFWRDFCDIFIPLGGLGYASPGLSALCGVVSSVIGFLQEWERHIKPFEANT